MTYSIKSFNIGTPKLLFYQGSEITTSFPKEPVTGPVMLRKEGFEGDGQADLKNHGGEDKALLIYPHVHYTFWEKHYARPFSLPSFGENISISELTEENVSIGDVFQLGDAVVQINQPRHPCFKIAAFLGIKDVTAMVLETGYSGFYARVLKEGLVDPDSRLVRKEKAEKFVSVAEVFDVSARTAANMQTIDKVLESPYAARSLKEGLQRKKYKLTRG